MPNCPSGCSTPLLVWIQKIDAAQIQFGSPASDPDYRDCDSGTFSLAILQSVLTLSVARMPVVLMILIEITSNNLGTKTKPDLFHRQYGRRPRPGRRRPGWAAR